MIFIGKSRSYEIIEYRKIIERQICTSSEIIKLLGCENEEYPEDIIPYKYSFPHEYIPGTQDKTNRFINYDMRASIDPRNNTFKNITIYFFVVCHEDIILYKEKGRKYLWYDKVTCELDNLFCGKTGKGTNGMLSGGALATMLGSEIEDGNHVIRYTDTIAVTANKGVTTETAIGTTGNEIGTIYVRDANNAYISGRKKLTQTSAEPATGEFSYDPETKEIKFFAGDVIDGTEVITFYDAEVEGKKISNNADNYSKTLQLFIDVTCQDGCDNLFHGQFIINRADFSGTFDIQGASDPATQGFEFTSMPNLCTGKSDLWDFILFD